MAEIFVTGATGKIGKKLLTQLLAKNYHVVALVRNKAKLPLKHPRLKLVIADLLQPEKYSAELKKCDYLFHLAAYQNIADPQPENFVRVNVKGTRLLLEASVNSQLKRFFYISTIMVFKPNKFKPISEESPKKKTGQTNYYVETKLLALKEVEKWRTKIPVVTFYPTIVIDPQEINGPSNKSNSSLLGFLWNIIGGGIPGGLMCLIGDKRRKINYILIDNLVQVLVKALTTRNLANDYILGGENISVENYLRQALKIKGRLFLPVRFPLFLLKLVSLFRIKQATVINFVAKNPPEDIYVNPQRAVDHFGLKITRIQDFFSSI